MCFFIDDENSHVQGVLTNDNLFDGTIVTSTEHFYIEPAHRYSENLPKSGVHTIIYKLSDVKLNAHNHNSINPLVNKTDHESHCASEKLHRKLNKESNSFGTDDHRRIKRWLQVIFLHKLLLKIVKKTYFKVAGRKRSSSSTGFRNSLQYEI